ncbi:MAG: hypothetical protein WCY88_08250 [Spongiibacteraceae bacterium]
MTTLFYLGLVLSSGLFYLTHPNQRWKKTEFSGSKAGIAALLIMLGSIVAGLQYLSLLTVIFSVVAVVSLSFSLLPLVPFCQALIMPAPTRQQLEEGKKQ